MGLPLTYPRLIGMPNVFGYFDPGYPHEQDASGLWTYRIEPVSASGLLLDGANADGKGAAKKVGNDTDVSGPGEH